jgi:hypothetical protein
VEKASTCASAVVGLQQHHPRLWCAHEQAGR